MLGKRIILVIDDEREVVDALYDLLYPEYQVLKALSGGEGQEIIEKEKGKIDLILCDHSRMPGMSGIELLRWARDNYPDIIRIILTGYVDLDLAVSAIKEETIDRYIIKPWDREDLKLIIKQAIEHNEMRKALAQKEQIAQIGEMAAKILHDLNNYLNPVLGQVQLLRHKPDMPISNRKQAYAAIEDRITQKIIPLLANLRDYIPRGELQLQVEEVNINDLLKEMLEENKIYFDERGVRIHLNLANECTTRLDRNKMERALLNICKNAAEAMEEGGDFYVSTELDGDYVNIYLRDTGPGIPEDIRDNMFKPFFTRGKKKGSGLGLIIANDIIRAHGGQIEFKTEMGRGTTFAIKLLCNGKPEIPSNNGGKEKDPFKMSLDQYLRLNPEEMRKIQIRAYEENREWIEEQLGRHKAAWILVCHGKVIESSTTFNDFPSVNRRKEISRKYNRVAFVFTPAPIIEEISWDETPLTYPIDDHFPAVEITVEGEKGKQALKADFDTGSNVTIFDLEVLHEVIALDMAYDNFRPAFHLNKRYDFCMKGLGIKILAENGKEMGDTFVCYCVDNWQNSPFVVVNPQRRCLLGRDIPLKLGAQINLNFKSKKSLIFLA